MRITNGTVVVEVDDDGWSIHWTAARVAVRGAVEGRPLRWSVTADNGPPGSLTVTHDGLHMTVTVPPEGPVVAVTAASDKPRSALVPLDVVVEMDPASTNRLLNGYQSWDYAGVRPAAEAGDTWWAGALAGPGAPGLAFVAASAGRLATSFSTSPRGPGIALTATCGATPEMEPTPGSWGFRAPGAGPLAPGATATASETVLLAAAADPLEAMESAAAAAGTAMGAWRWHGVPIVGWESWYHYGFSITPEALLANADLLRARMPETFRVVQLDDGWQRAYGDWRPGRGWPDDLGEVTAAVRNRGCVPGLWLAPFMVWPGGPGIGGRPDLLIGEHQGTGPRTDPLMQRHGVDATNPEALAWLHDLGAQVRRWGFEMVKLDFLYIGALEGARHDSAATGTEAFRSGMAAFLEGLGAGAYVLACGAPFAPVVGLCHGNRIGGDLAAPLVWPFEGLDPFPREESWRGILPQARNAAARWWCHRRWFDADPDVVMAAGPEAGPPYSVDDVRALAALVALCGGPYFLADDLAALEPSKWAALRDPFVEAAAWGEGFRPLDLFDRPDTVDPGTFQYFSLPTDLPRRWARMTGPTADFEPGPPLRVLRQRA
jgi:alpha-galactosidase